MKNKKVILDVDNVSFSYGKKEVLRDVSFKVYDKDFVGVIGPNGGGKTTLLRLLIGEIKPLKGKIRIAGKKPSRAVAKIGYLSQFKRIDFDFPITVYDIVLQSRLGPGPIKNLSQNDRLVVERVMKKLSLWSLRDNILGELSGGEKQRVFVARALAKEPQILILDEPMANVDFRIQESFYKLLKELNKEVAIIIVDHDVEVVAKYAKEVICVNKCKTHTVQYHEADALRLKGLCHV